MKPAGTQGTSLSQQPQSLRSGDIAFARMEKVNAELVAITYGALVSQLFQDTTGNAATVSQSLDRIGYNMGIRMVDEFLAKSIGINSCSSFNESMEVLTRVAVKMFVGIDCELIEVIANQKYVINFPENPLNDFVELPVNLKSSGFSYSSLYCGMIRGAFEQLHMRVACQYVKDTLWGDDVNSIQVTLEGIIRPDDDED